MANLLKSRVQLRRMFTGTTTEQEEQEALSAKDQTFVEQLRKTIKSHIPDANYSVEDLGEEMGLSRVQLYRKVKALTGYTVVDLLRKARLARAKRLLETTDKNISEVAYEVGFSTPSYFAKRFKEEYGVKPGELQ
ncbi:MAG: helix-turn-helix transcriptional regulator [Hallella sp.]|uniref:helix-turn-helix domain-containing protein n=1 Tax=Hallella sp. TaxID=2980186 RepID=UPI002E75C74A|nr:helix-turn-helix transcriptional regulator [Hallella sp.]MED9946288.1 helix-turn-helix transcriptional regulator [Hallella sp.]